MALVFIVLGAGFIINGVMGLIWGLVILVIIRLCE